MQTQNKRKLGKLHLYRGGGRIDFQTTTIIKDKERHFIMIKGLTKEKIYYL